MAPSHATSAPLAQRFGRFENYDASLTVADDVTAKLLGTVDVTSIEVKDDNLAGHLQSPDFFDAERHSELRFESESIRIDGSEVVVDGHLTIKGQTRPVEARGTIVGPHEDIAGNTKLGLELTAIVDRTELAERLRRAGEPGRTTVGVAGTPCPRASFRRSRRRRGRRIRPAVVHRRAEAGDRRQLGGDAAGSAEAGHRA